MAKRSCSNCKRRMFSCWSGIDYCMDYEMACGEEGWEKAAKNCPAYEEGIPSCLEEDDYRPSASNRDYGPSNPWDAPGMSIRDFI